jgi:dipeptidyl aminopeptidase/acylaminoacyl peptidase
MIRCDDGVRIHSWLMLRSEQDKNVKKVPTIVFFHGNAGTRIMLFVIHDGIQW